MAAEETTDADSTELGFAEAMTFLSDRVAAEESEYEHDVPDHAPSLVVSEASNLLQTATSIQMARQMDAEGADSTEDGEDDGLDEEGMTESLEDDVVNIITALAALKHEEGLDIAGAVEDRMAFIEDYKEFEEAMQNADDREEQMEVMDELMTDEIADELGMGPQQMDGGGPTIGENVDRDDYDHDDEGKGFQ